MDMESWLRVHDTALVSVWFESSSGQFVCRVEGVAGGPFEGAGSSLEAACGWATSDAGWAGSPL